MSVYLETNTLRHIAFDYECHDLIENIEYDYGFGVLDHSRKEEYWKSLDAQTVLHEFAKRLDDELRTQGLKLEKDKSGKWQVKVSK